MCRRGFICTIGGDRSREEHRRFLRRVRDVVVRQGTWRCKARVEELNGRKSPWESRGKASFNNATIRNARPRNVHGGLFVRYDENRLSMKKTAYSAEKCDGMSYQCGFNSCILLIVYNELLIIFLYTHTYIMRVQLMLNILSINPQY